MKIQTVDIDLVKPYDRNPRKNDQSVGIVAQSLQEYGFQQPIVVDRDYCIIVGHTRHLAAKKLGLTEVPVVVAEHLTEDQVRAYRIADNKTNEYSQWDLDLLSNELDALMSNYDINSVSALTGMNLMDIGDLVFDQIYHKNQYNDLVLENKGLSSRRVAILVDRFFAQRHWGITTYIVGWLEWARRHGYYVDMISDFAKEDLNHTHFDKYQNFGRWICPESFKNPQPAQSENLNLDTDLFLKSGNNIALDVASRMRLSILEALSLHCYDAVIINNHDGLLSILSTGLHCHLDNLYYVPHSGIDTGWYHNFSRYSARDAEWRVKLLHALLKSGNVKVICQTERARDNFVEFANYDPKLSIYCPVQIAQIELQDFETVEDRKGILWIGRWEAIKDPELYIKLCKQSGLPALVITGSATSARKFKKRFLEEKIEHEIHVGLTGQHKINVMRSAAVAVQTSVDETFCYAAFEAAHCCPLILPQERQWSQIHKDWAIIVPINQMADALKENYGKTVAENVKQKLQEFVKLGDGIIDSLLKKPVVDTPFSNAFTKWLEKVGQGTVEDFFKTRPRVVFDEVIYPHKLQYHEDYEVMHGLEFTLFKYKKFDPAKAQKVLSYKKT